MRQAMEEGLVAPDCLNLGHKAQGTSALLHRIYRVLYNRILYSKILFNRHLSIFRSIKNHGSTSVLKNLNEKIMRTKC